MCVSRSAIGIHRTIDKKHHIAAVSPEPIDCVPIAAYNNATHPNQTALSFHARVRNGTIKSVKYPLINILSSENLYAT